MKHRIGVSYNEQSGRYMEFEPVFYTPPKSRGMVQVGKPGKYEMHQGGDDMWEETQRALRSSYQTSWDVYRHLLEVVGVAREAARMALPVAAYSAAYVSMNPRSIMHFLSLRTHDSESMFPSYPMWEIAQVGRQIEAYFAEHFPITHEAFEINGRVCP